MDVLTTCVIVAEHRTSDAWSIRGVAIGHAMCMPEDNFRKKFARDSSFKRAVDCALLADVKDQLLAAYESVAGPSEVRERALTSRDRHRVASVLDEMCAKLDAETAEKIKAATEALRKSAPKTSHIDPKLKQEKIDAGAAIREMRATNEGRANLAAQRRGDERIAAG